MLSKQTNALGAAPFLPQLMVVMLVEQMLFVFAALIKDAVEEMCLFSAKTRSPLYVQGVCSFIAFTATELISENTNQTSFGRSSVVFFSFALA